MASWSEVANSAPEFAAAVRGIFEAHTNKLLATLRKDGSPRISAIEGDFRDGELWLGMMFDSVKARDLQRDRRFALHSASPDVNEDDPSDWAGDAKLAGVAVEITDAEHPQMARTREQSPDSRAHLFRTDIHEVVWTRVGDPADHLLIEVWREGADLRRIKRR